jgi:purine-binding chemotaxis protein CheW
MKTARQHRKRSLLDWETAKLRLAAASRGDRTLDAAEIARVLSERAAILARVPESAGIPEAMLELLHFTLGKERCAVETRYVNEVVRPSELTRLPGAPAHMLGIMNLRGMLLPVFDLRELLRAGAGESSERARLLVLGRERAEVGVYADAVQGITTIPESALLSHADASLGGPRDYLRGVTREAHVVIDVAELLADDRLCVGDTEELVSQDG